MKKALLIEDNQQISEVYRLNLLTYADIDVSICVDINSATETLNKNTFDLIISRSKIGKSNAAVETADHLKKIKKSIPMIVIGEGPFPDGIVAVIPGSLDLKLVVKSSASALGITAQEMAKKDVDDYFPIGSVFFSAVNFPEVPVYKKNQEEFLLLFESHKEINHEAYKDNDFLYVQKLDRLKMVNQISSELMMKIDLDKLNPIEEIQAIEVSVEMITKKLMAIGFHEETIAQAEKSMKAIRNNCKKNPKLGLLLSRLDSNKSGYLFKHMQIVTYIALHLLKRLDWGKSAEQEDKMSFVCYFHDIALENDKQATIDSTEELLASGLTFREKALIEKHAQMAADIIAKHPVVPHGVEQIIKQHHGILNGVGFTDQFAANMAPMATVFIIAEGFTKIVIRAADGPFNKSEMIQELKSKYSSLKLKKMVDLLESIVF